MKERTALPRLVILDEPARGLPAHVVVYYVIALALYMRSSYREVLRQSKSQISGMDSH